MGSSRMKGLMTHNQLDHLNTKLEQLCVAGSHVQPMDNRYSRRLEQRRLRQEEKRARKSLVKNA